MISRSILVADDDALLRDSLCDLIADLGHEPRPAGTAGQAIEVLAHQRCDLLLSDVDMPDMTGFQLLGWIQGHQPLPSVLMSARADEHLCQAALQAGALALWAKPVSAGTISGFMHGFFDDLRQ